MGKNNNGRNAFLIGLVLSLVLAFMPGLLGTWSVPTLIIIGLAVGYMNVKEAESVAVLVAFLTLAVGIGILSNLPGIGSSLGALLPSLTAFFGGAAALVSFKTLYSRLGN